MLDGGLDWAAIAPPIEFESRERVEAFAELILDAHSIVECGLGCFKRPEGPGTRESLLGRVTSVVEGTFVGYFGFGPHERFDDVFDQAAYLAIHLALDHIFADGNKRTALMLALLLPEMRGITLDFSDSPNPEENDPYKWIQRAVSRECGESELAEKLRSWAHFDIAVARKREFQF